ncbi:MAG TPA: J domain-containing protein [Candidatus Limnocylindrales bacterium]|nr:J domain-containing protein [Candidatus Limnocylindrales bacterium]
MAAPEFQDYYKTLGVSRTATQAEIKKAFRKLARESHPDKHPGDKSAEARFKAINEANAVLSDTAKRAKYDQFGKDWEAYARAGATGGAGDPFGGANPFAGWASQGGSTRRSGSSAGVRYEFRTTGGGAGGGAFSDFFHMMFGDENAAAGEPERFGGGGTESIDELLARMGMAGAAGAAGSGARNGTRTGSARATGSAPRSAVAAPIEVTADLSLEESFHGTSRIVEIGGKRLEVTIPRGAGDGSRIKLTGKAPGGGDLVVVTRLRPHPVFSRRGDDLEREVPITLGEALLGGEIPVSTLKGRVLLKVPAATQPGRVIRLKGQGMPRFKGDGTGDLLVRVRVVLPTELSDEAKAAATRLADLLDQPDPRA